MNLDSNPIRPHESSNALVSKRFDERGCIRCTPLPNFVVCVCLKIVHTEKTHNTLNIKIRRNSRDKSEKCFFFFSKWDSRAHINRCFWMAVRTENQCTVRFCGQVRQANNAIRF